MDRKGKPLTPMSKKEREEVWDDVFAKEERIIIEFNMNTNSGKVRSVKDGATYIIDKRELVKTKIELRAGDKILFAPFESKDGGDYAGIIKIIALNA
jgi:hypothetical protein